jgi:hypothetical protein
MALAEGERKKPGRRAGGRRPRPGAGSPRGAERPVPAAGAGGGPEGGLLPDLLRRGLSLGFTGLFMTEEALRRAFGDGLPRDWLEFFAAQSDRTRAELVERLSREFGRVLSAVDPVEILRRLLDGQTLEIRAQVRLRSGADERGPRGPAASPTREPDPGDGA